MDSVRHYVIFMAVFMVAEPRVISAVIQKRYEFMDLGLAENPGSRFVTWTDAITPKMLYADAIVDMALYDPLCGAHLIKWNCFLRYKACSLVLLLVLLLRYFQLPAKENRPLVAFALVFALVFYWMVGATVPIMGAIVHYRILATPFLVIGLLGFVNLKKFKYDLNRLPDLKN